MIISLSDYRNESTPFLNRVLVTGDFANIKGVGKCGFGPSISTLGEEKALEYERILVSSYVDSWIRGQIYLYACNHGFKPEQVWKKENVFKPSKGLMFPLAPIPQEAQRYPLRADADGTINPVSIVEGGAVLNPEWTRAPKEYFFSFDQDVLKLDGHVSRALRNDHYAFKIDLALRIPPDSVSVEIRPRDLTK